MTRSTRLQPALGGWFGAIAAVLAIGVALPASAQQRIRFQLDWRFEGPAAFFLLPVSKGYFKQEGLDVVVDTGSGSGATVTRVASGAYEMGFADISAMVEFISNNAGKPETRMQAVMMVYDHSPAAVITLKKNGITKPQDLNGKTLGAPVFDAGRRGFPIFQKANNINNVTWVSMDPPLRETMLARGDIDAITGFTFTSLLNLNARGVKDEDVVMLRYPNYGVNLYGNAIIATEKFIKENPKAIAGFLKAFLRGARDVIANPDAAVQVIKERDPLIDVALEQRRLKMAINDVIGTPEYRANGIGTIDRKRFEDTVTQVTQAFGLKTAVDAASLFNDSFMPPQAERRVFAK